MNIKYMNSMMRFLIVCLLLSSQLAKAQTVTVVRGKVTDKSNQEPIIGASVILVDKEKRTIAGVSTDIEGNYSLPVKDPKSLITVSYLGYKTTNPIAIDKAVINFRLESASNQLQELAITAKRSISNGTLNIDARNLTTSIATVSAKDMEEMQAASIDQALQGRLPGVDIATASGDPGVGMQIRIRGTSTLNGTTDPLIVVDGMPYEITVPSDFNFSTSDENGYGQLLNIAPADIADISVLKDAAATAVWGSRGSNGVLLINTKRGRIGKPSLTYVFKGSLSKQPDALPMLNGNQYSSLIQEMFYNAGTPFALSANARQFQYDKNDPYNYYNFSNNTDWIGALTQTGHVQDHTFSINGGGERARYLASMAYNNTEGTTKGTSLNRISTRINLDYTVSDRIRFAANFAYTHVDNDQLYNGGVRGNAYNKMPNQSVYEYDEFGRLTSNYFSPVSTAQGTYPEVYNPLAMAMEGMSKNLGERITPLFRLNYTVIPGLFTAQGSVQIDINNQKSKRFLPQIATGRPYTDVNVNAAADQESDQFTIATKLDFTLTPNLGDNQTFLGVVSLQSNDNRNSGQGLSTTNTASSFLQDPSIPSRNNASGSVASSLTQSRNVGVLIQGQYGLLDRYIINAFVRGDGNSKFGPANRYAFYPGMSARWRISGEPFMKKASTFLDDLSLRVSFGQSGNAPGSNYAFYNIYQSFSTNYIGETGVFSTDVELSNLKWETVTDRNLGLDVSMFKSRLTMTADVYRKRTTDLFLPSVAIPNYNGFTSVDLNGGTLDNNGWEFSIQGRAVKTKDWNVDLQFNIAHNENLIREISRLYPRENNARVTSNNVYKSYLQINNPFGSFYGFRSKGVYSDKAATVARGRNGEPIVAPDGQQVYMRFGYPSIDYIFQPGDARYEDINYDGVIDYKDVVYLGNGNPKLTGGAGITVRYKGNLTLTSFFSWRTGNDLINGTKISTTSMFGYNNQSTAVLRRWKKEGDETDIPRALYNKGYNYLGSDRYVEDGSFLRLRTLTARYNVSKNITNKLRIKSLSPYLTAENLLTFTNYTGQDPEVSTRIGNAFTTIIDNSQTPPVKTFTFGLNATF